MQEDLENMRQRLYEIESSKRNNLVFHGILAEEGETKAKLLTKIHRLLSCKLNIGRFIPIKNVVRVSSGPDIIGCRPVMVTFESFRDREDVFLKSQMMIGSWVYVTEDLAKHIMKARKELRKFMVMVKTNSPKTRCYLQYDKLYVDGKLFVYKEALGKVEETCWEVGPAALDRYRYNKHIHMWRICCSS